MSKITLTCDGRPRKLQADYLNPAALEYWRAWLAAAARKAHNPFEEFALKVRALPPELQAVATREFAAGVDFAAVPPIVVLETVRSLAAVKVLCVLVTGQDCVTEANAREAFALLLPFISRPQEIVAGSIEEANRLRAEVGKPPIGRRAERPASGPSPTVQSPQGG